MVHKSTIPSSGGGGSGTVTSVSVATANGLAGTVATATTTPVITLTTSVTGVLKGNGTAISAATAGTDYVLPGGALGTPSSGVATNLTGTASGLTAGNVTTNANLTGDVTSSGNATTIKTNVGLAGSPTTTTQAQGDSSTKVSTTAYVDLAVSNAIAGVNPAVAVQAATTAASDTSGLTYTHVAGIGDFFTGSVNTAIVVDGFTFNTLGQRLLVKNDTQSPSGSFNGVYYVTQVQTGILAPILTRALDYDTPSDMNNTGAIPVINGTVNGTTSWLLTSTVVTVGTTPLTFAKFSINPSTIVTGAAGSTTQVQYNSSSAFSGAANLVIDAGGSPNTGDYSSTNPATPSTGLTAFSRNRCGYRRLSVIGADANPKELASFQGSTFIHTAVATGSGSTNTTQYGFSASTVTGTATAVTYAPSSLLGAFSRVSYLSTAGTSASCGALWNNRIMCRGSVAGCGGFEMVCRVSIDVIAASQAFMAACVSVTADIGDTDPSAQVNMIGFGADAGDSNLQFMHNDGSGTATKVDLGVNFPAKTSGAIYELRIGCLPNDSVMYYSAQRLDVAQFTEGNANSDLPTNTTLMEFQLHGGTRAVGTAVTVGFQQLYIEVLTP